MNKQQTPPTQCRTGGLSAEVGAQPMRARAAGTAVGDADTLTPGGVCFVCMECGAERKAKRIPPGWKRDGDLAVCKTCWKERFALRAVSIPVWLPNDAEALKSLRADLKTGWQVARRTANFILRHLYLHDDWGAVDAGKLPKFPGSPEHAKRLYDATREYAPDYTTVSMSALMHWLRQTYARRRFDIWIGKASLPTQRNVPWFVRKTGWTPTADGGAVTITCHGERRTLQLSPKRDFAKQRALLARAAAGELLRGDAKLCDDWPRVMFRAAVWMPIEQRDATPSGTLIVASAPDVLLRFARDDGKRAMRPLHMRHLRQWVAAHDEWRQAMADDAKYEKRWPTRNKRDMLAKLDRRCGRANNRLRTACQQIAAIVCGYALRQNLAEIAVDFSVEGYMPRFPWHQLEASISAAAELRGLGCARQENEV